MRECFCLFLFLLHFTEGCDVLDHIECKEVTGYTGGSVLLPCSCTDSQSTVKKFTWLILSTAERNEVFKNESYKDRWKLFNERAPANLSLLIYDLKKKDKGNYRCEISAKVFSDISVTIKEPHVHTTTDPIIKQTGKPPTEQSEDSSEKQLFILLSLLPVVLLLAVLAFTYWKCKGRRDVQKTTNDGLVLVCSENKKQGNVNSESPGENLKHDDNENEVTYSSVVHVKTAGKPAHIQIVIAEHSEYASIK